MTSAMTPAITPEMRVYRTPASSARGAAPRRRLARPHPIPWTGLALAGWGRGPQRPANNEPKAVP
jgi:hypothetical protein